VALCHKEHLRLGAFSDKFLRKYSAFIYQMEMNRWKAFFMFPPRACCHSECECYDQRQAIQTTLNIDLYEREARKNKTIYSRRALAHLLNIPDEKNILRYALHTKWSLEKIQSAFESDKLQKKLKRVASMTWILLRLQRTYEQCPLQIQQPSIQEALSLLIGGNNGLPAYQQKTDLMFEENLGGEKVFEEDFKIYRPLCHRVTTYFYLKAQQKENAEQNSEFILTFLKIADGIKQKLLLMKTNNVKRNRLFDQKSFMNSSTIFHLSSQEIIIPEFSEKLHKIGIMTFASQDEAQTFQKALDSRQNEHLHEFFMMSSKAE
jgi:hypothetical protein